MYRTRWKFASVSTSFAVWTLPHNAIQAIFYQCLFRSPLSVCNEWRRDLPRSRRRRVRLVSGRASWGPTRHPDFSLFYTCNVESAINNTHRHLPTANCSVEPPAIDNPSIFQLSIVLYQLFINWSVWPPALSSHTLNYLLCHGSFAVGFSTNVSVSVTFFNFMLMDTQPAVVSRDSSTRSFILWLHITCS